MNVDASFYNAILGAGSVLAGFCGTFLSFRIQREASYYQQPVLSWEAPHATFPNLGSAKNVEIKMTHFTGALLLLCLATAGAASFGVVYPLLALAGVNSLLVHPSIPTAGLFGSIVLVSSYFVAELLHYEVLSKTGLNDIRSEISIIALGMGVAAAVSLLTLLLL